MDSPYWYNEQTDKLKRGDKMKLITYTRAELKTMTDKEIEFISRNIKTCDKWLHAEAETYFELKLSHIQHQAFN